MKHIVILLGILLFSYSAAFGDELVYSQDGFGLAQGSSVAIAPFQDLTRSLAVGDKFAGYIAQALKQEGTIRIIGEDQFKTSLAYNRFKQGLSVDRSIAQKIGQQLGVNYVIFGSVIEYGYELAPDGKKTLPIAGVDVRIVSVNSGRIVFAGSFATEGSPGSQLDNVAMEAAKAFYDRVRQ